MYRSVVYSLSLHTSRRNVNVKALVCACLHACVCVRVRATWACIYVQHTSVTHQQSQCNVCIQCSAYILGVFFALLFICPLFFAFSLSLCSACDSNFLVQQINHFWAAWSLHVNDKQRQKLYSKQMRCSNYSKQSNIVSSLFGLVHTYLCCSMKTKITKESRLYCVFGCCWIRCKNELPKNLCWNNIMIKWYADTAIKCYTAKT